ncbi:MAG: methylglyoxal synthase [Eubacteriales bacterium]|nr:methylglyoxal synthase [Clostridiales bacterium]MDO4452879.1 methylglyoxal synthase [Eubacteriales bacterium]
MNIGLIAHNSKRTLLEDFCIAYKRILSKHELYATGTTGRRVEEVTNLKVHKFLPGSIGGDRQFMEMIERNSMDMVLFFYNPAMIDPKEPDIYEISRRCDQYNIPMATNIATAESLILGLDRGDLDWRLL